MATICLRQEGGSHNFQDRQIKVENRFVTVGRTTEARKPDLANATFSSLGISEEQAVFFFFFFEPRWTFFLRPTFFWGASMVDWPHGKWELSLYTIAKYLCKLAHWERRRFVKKQLLPRHTRTKYVEVSQSPRKRGQFLKNIFKYLMFYV